MTTPSPASKLDLQTSQNSGPSSEEKKLHKEGEKPANVPLRLWEKFKSLEKRTNEVTQRSTEKRIKHLQKKVMETVTREFTSPEDKDILREHDVKFGPPVEKTRKRKISAEDERLCVPSTTSDKRNEIMSLMSINDHLQTTDHSRPPPETSLEKRLACAIKEGNFNTAEALSDKIATLEAGEKVAAAFDAKRFLERKEEEKETAKAKKKKKLNWGFEAKQRWETKGNM